MNSTQTCRLTKLLAILLLTLPVMVRAQFNFMTNDGDITILSYTGSNVVVTIPNTTNGHPVTAIAGQAFYFNTNVTSVTIGTNVTSIGGQAFGNCYALTNVVIPASVNDIESDAFSTCISLLNATIPYGVTTIQDDTFDYCYALTNVTIPDTVTTIGDGAFSECVGLVHITIPASVTTIGEDEFYYCYSLASVFFQGNAPSYLPIYGPTIFEYDNPALPVYYLPNTSGWTNTCAGQPTMLWNPQTQAGGVQTNRFGFNITGSTNLVLVVEACTNLSHPAWLPVSTNTLTGGSSYFSDPKWTNYQNRFYRLSSP